MNPSDRKLAKWLKVSSIRYLGPQRFKKLYELMNEQLDDILLMSEQELLTLKGIVTPQVIKGIEDVKKEQKDFYKIAITQLKNAAKCDGKIILIGDNDYPTKLYNSSMSHAIVYSLGDIKLFKDDFKSIGIVGTRSPNSKSINSAKELSVLLSKQGFVIVSGLAKGIDSIAHNGALLSRGRTIAVLGGGPDVIYPAESKEIYKLILKEGLLISEYPFGTRPSSLNLKKRNKTTVAFSDAIVIVETKKDGGTMNAVQGAKEQHKKLFVFDGEGEEFSGNKLVLGNGGILLSRKNPLEIIEDNLHV